MSKAVEHDETTRSGAADDGAPGGDGRQEVLLADLKRELRARLTAPILERLDRRGIHTLGELRQAGGIREVAKTFDGASVGPKLANELEAHVRLSVLPTTVSENARLVEAGFTSLDRIADAPRAEFVAALGDALGLSKAGAVHDAAGVQSRFMTNLLTEALVAGSYAATSSTSQALSGIAPEVCACDCRDATSPVAYLTDLLDYAVKHLRHVVFAEGLTGEYFADNSFQQRALERIDPGIDFDWGAGAPIAGLPADGFTVRWTGSVRPRYSEGYSFYVAADDGVEGVRLWVDGQLVVDRTSFGGGGTPLEPAERSGRIYLTADQAYDIRLDYADSGGAANVSLAWSSFSQQREVIPKERLAAVEKTEPITLQFLEDRYHQPFLGLPERCSYMEDALRQVRIACEVLRAELPPALRGYQQTAYVRAVYELLLEQIGTSYRELADTVAAGDAHARRALAMRLGILERSGSTVIDHLDDLLLDIGDPAALTEDALELRFGYRSTTRPPLDPTPPAGVLEWRRQVLRQQWLAEDWPQSAPAAARPLIDPDLIGPPDLKDSTPTVSFPRTPVRPMDFLEDRRQWLQQKIIDIDAALKDPSAGFEALITDKFTDSNGVVRPLMLGLGVAVADFEDLIKRRLDGEDVQAEIAGLELDAEGFDFLSFAWRTDKKGGTLTAADWESVTWILAQHLKRQTFPTWRSEEQARSFTLSQDHFQLRPPPRPGFEFPWTPTPYRSTEADRRAWEDRLRTRIEREQTLIQAMDEAIDAAEEAYLAELRNDLLRTWASPGAITAAKLAALTDRLQLDMEAGVCERTTRVAQAIATVQGALFGAREGLLEGHDLVLDDAVRFDAAWRWLGAYATWKAAMRIFLHPENALRPTLRRQRSGAFDELVEALRAQGRVSPEDAQEAADTYSAFFHDVCSLSFVALAQVSPPPDEPQTGAPWYLVVARGGFSGRLYYCTQDRRPDWWLAGGFRRGFWNAVPGLDATADVSHLVSYRSAGRTQVAAYWTSGAPGSRKLSCSRYDGSGWSMPRSTGTPTLVASARLGPGSLPASASLVAAGIAGWPVRINDRLALLDVDGDGRRELLLVAGDLAPDGTRAVGLARELAGDLFLDRVAHVPGNWDLPGGSQVVVLRTALVQTPSRYREALLVVDATGAELALLGMRPADAGPAVFGETTGQAVPGPAGVNPWSVNPGAQFLSADVDGDGFSELVAVEQITPGSAYPNVVPIDVSEAGFDHWMAQEALFGRPARVVPVRTSALSGRDSLLGFAVHQNPTRTLVEVLTWDETTNAFTRSIEAGRAKVRAGAPTLDDDDPSVSKEGWTFQSDDRVAALEWDRGAPGQELLLTSDSRLETAVGTVGANPPIAFPQPESKQFELIWRSAKRIEAAPDGEGQSWARQLGDRFVAADLDGDGAQELVVVSPDGHQAGVLARTGDGKLDVYWSDVGLVPGPGGASDPAWPLAPGSTYVAGDIDGDGCEEIVVRDGDRLGILRGAPPRRTAFELGVRDTYGPSGIEALDVVNQASPRWRPTRPAEIRTAYERNRGVSGTYVDDPDVPHLDEAYYFVPVELALRLDEAGNHGPALDWLRSVYDYERRRDDRKIAYGLVINGDADYTFVRSGDWVRDPLNPHAVAGTRRDTYARFTILSEVRSLLAFADAEFTRATAESLPRARELYLKALELLDAPELKERASLCEQVLGGLEIKIGDDQERWTWEEILRGLGEIESYSKLLETAGELKRIMASDGDTGERLARASELVAGVDGGGDHGADLAAIRDRDAAARDAAVSALLARDVIASTAEAMVGGNGASGALETIDRPPWAGHWTYEWIPAPSVSFCISPNPVLQALRTHAQTNLHKLRSCRSIAGTELRVPPYDVGAAAVAVGGDGLPSPGSGGFEPLPYRYATLIERTKQLVELARQMEGSMLAAIQGSDRAQYEEMKARHDMGLAQSEVRLRDLQVVQATDAVRTAELQRQRATISAKHYQDLLMAGMTTNEQLSIGFLYGAAALHVASAASSFYGVASVEGVVSFGSSPIAQGLSSLAAASSTLSQVSSAYAAHERLEQEWTLQRDTGLQDVRIGASEVKVAEDQARVAGQERFISALQLSNAEEVLDFLTTRQTGTAELYEWMSGVLEQIYCFFLQQATSMARLAEAQLAFERQELPRAFIRNDYWEPPVDAPPAVPSDGQPTDRHGLTGSERLLRDVADLDDYAFRTEQRKLQLSKTISLAQLDPVAFERFRDSGVLTFATPMRLFDRDFPGHYLRLIKRVRTSVIALIPPTQGIHATLSTTGPSRVVIGGDGFETAVVQRAPESVALTAPINSTGLFELNPQPEILAPFEGLGVDATWELRLPKAANLLDYSGIADVLLMLDYTALDSYDYRARLVQDMDRRLVAERPFMFRHAFADAWYDLHNPEELDDEKDRMVVRFRTGLDDFPPNLAGLSIRNVTLYFGRARQDTAEVKVENLKFTHDGTSVSSGQISSGDGVISTRRANAGGLTGMIGMPPDGEWELSLNYADPQEDATIRRRFKDELIEDVLLVVTYGGATAPWPA